MRIKIAILLSSILVSWYSLYAADTDSLEVIRHDVQWNVEVLGGGSTGQWAPYLIGSNSGGRHAMKGTAAVEGAISHAFDMTKRFSWTAGVDLAGSYQSDATYAKYIENTEEWTERQWHPSRATVYQLWGGIKYRGLMLWAGMKDHKSLIVDDELSSGDLLLSNNARAIPQVEVGFVDYQNIPFTRGWAQINVALSYGRYTDGKSLENRYNYWNDHITLNQLFTYKRVHFRSNPDKPLSVTIGVQLGGEFGGTTYVYWYGNLSQTLINPKNLRAYFEMLFPIRGHSYDGYYEGNHIGSWDFKARYRLQSGIDLEGYFQWVWEDGSAMAKRNMTDGLWGVSVTLPGKKRALKKIVAEYIDFRDQSGPIHWAPGDNPGTTITTEATGGDNTYNNSAFNAWANYGLALGSSFPKAPLYNSDGFPQFEHNRTHGFQVAATGCLSNNVDWTAKLSYAVAWGMGRVPIAESLKNTSMLLTARWDASRLLKGLSISASAAFDAGKLRGDNFGVLVKATYSGAFNLKKQQK